MVGIDVPKGYYVEQSRSTLRDLNRTRCASYHYHSISADYFFRQSTLSDSLLLKSCYIPFDVV